MGFQKPVFPSGAVNYAKNASQDPNQRRIQFHERESSSKNENDELKNQVAFLKSGIILCNRNLLEAFRFIEKYHTEFGIRWLFRWLGITELDLSSFDIGDMNFRLKKVPRIYAEAYEYDMEPTRQSMKLLMREYKK